MKILETDRDPAGVIMAALSPQEAGPNTKLESTVRDIIAQVKASGDDALMELGRKFDSPELQSLKVSDAEFEEAYNTIKPELLNAIRTAKANITAFHEKQLQKSWIDTQEDFIYGQIVKPLDSVGLYVPSGQAPLASTVLMTAIPAAVAGVKRIVMCTPAQSDARADGPTLVAASECGVKTVYKAGGAQAIAAMAYGTKTIQKVDKIVGPGNPYVAEAKRQLFGVVGIDQIAGPSEILVIADDSANPVYIAADILSQAEHASDSRCALITNNRQMADAVLKEVRRQTELASRKDLINASLQDFGIIIIARDIDECAELANVFAPEHLEIVTRQPWDVLKKIRHAGTIMLGHYTPVPLCDFAAGPNHTLPTGSTARFSSALSVDDFVKKSGLLSYTREGLERIAPTVLEMAASEGLDAHANTVKLRMPGKAEG